MRMSEAIETDGKLRGRVVALDERLAALA